MVYNTASDVRRVLHLDSSNDVLTDTEIDEYLEEANEDLFSEIKKNNEIDYITIVRNSQGVLIEDYTLSLTPVVTINKVWQNNILLDSGDYSFDQTTSLLSFTGDIEQNDEMRVSYTPKIYALAELYICAYNINISTQILNRGGDSNPVAENIEKKKDNFIEVIMSKLIVATWH